MSRFTAEGSVVVRRQRFVLPLPTDPSEEELVRDWTLSESDLGEIRRCRGAGNRLRFALRFPIVPLPGGGTARFQPLHVEDLARAVRAALFGTMSGVFEVGGPDPVTYRQLLAETMRAYGIRRPTVPMPVFLMKPAAFVFERTMADPPVTGGQLDLLAVDNTPHPNAIDQVFGVHPRPFVGGGLSYLAQR